MKGHNDPHCLKWRAWRAPVSGRISRVYNAVKPLGEKSELSTAVNRCTLTLTNSTILGNTATGNPGEGGGIFNSGTLTLSNSTVLGNAADFLGGGIENKGGTLTLSNSTISGNAARFFGGGISNEVGGTLTLINSTVSGNSAIEGGGIYNYFFNNISGSELTMSNSTVSDNKASQDGGGIYNNGTLTLNNSTVSGNRANRGGGIAISDYVEGSHDTFPVQVMLLYCTQYGNTANRGGGIWIDTVDKKSQVTIGASIIAGNSAHTGHDIAGHLTTLGYNLVGDRSGAMLLGPSKVQSTDMLGVSLTDLGIDPMLRDNSGSARPHTWTHALLPGSPAIDAIPLQYCQVKGIFNSRSRMYTDQRGMKRPDGNEQFCDIGAYESSP